MPLSMLLLITESAVMTPITEKTPMETPVIVRMERSLFVRRAPSAMRIASLRFIGHSPLIRPSGTFSPRAGRRGTVAPRPAQRGEGGAKRRVRGVSLISQRLDRIEPRHRQRRRESGADAGPR